MDIFKEIKITDNTVKFLDEYNTSHTFPLKKGRYGCAMFEHRGTEYYFMNRDGEIVAFLLFGNKLLARDGDKHDLPLYFSSEHNNLIQFKNTI